MLAGTVQRVAQNKVGLKALWLNPDLGTDAKLCQRCKDSLRAMLIRCNSLENGMVFGGLKKR